MENPLQTIAVTVAAGVLAWMADTLINVDKRTAVIEVRVEENYKMLEPMWQDWLSTKRNAGYEQNVDEKTDHTAPAEEKEAKEDIPKKPVEVVLLEERH